MDIVPELIAENRRRYGSIRRTFIEGDICQSAIPHVDLILCRDCFAHLPLDYAIDALNNFKSSGSTYLATTTFPSIRQNRNVATWRTGLAKEGFVPGDYRGLNLELEPFNMPKPFALLDELNADGKHLGLWKIA